MGRRESLKAGWEEREEGRRVLVPRVSADPCHQKDTAAVTEVVTNCRQGAGLHGSQGQVS